PPSSRFVLLGRRLGRRVSRGVDPARWWRTGRPGPAPTAAAPIGEEDAEQEDARHADEEEEHQVDDEQGDEEPDRPAEGEEPDRNEEQDEGEQDRLGDEAAEAGTLVRVQTLVVANRQAIPLRTLKRRV